MSLQVPVSAFDALEEDFDRALERVADLETERDATMARIAELERENAELKRLWFSDADPRETAYAAEYAAIVSEKEKTK